MCRDETPSARLDAGRATRKVTGARTRSPGGVARGTHTPALDRRGCHLDSRGGNLPQLGLAPSRCTPRPANAPRERSSCVSLLSSARGGSHITCGAQYDRVVVALGRRVGGGAEEFLQAGRASPRASGGGQQPKICTRREGRSRAGKARQLARGSATTSFAPPIAAVTEIYSQAKEKGTRDFSRRLNVDGWWPATAKQGAQQRRPRVPASIAESGRSGTRVVGGEGGRVSA